jgi:hypothetical protein
MRQQEPEPGKKPSKKELINQFKTFKGIRLGTKDLILEAVDNKNLKEIKHNTLGYLNQTPRQMIEHLLTCGSALPTPKNF